MRNILSDKEEESAEAAVSSRIITATNRSESKSVKRAAVNVKLCGLTLIC